MMIDWNEARKIILSLTKTPKVELVDIEDSLGRVIAEEVYADRDYPPFNRASVDGFAIKAENFSNQKTYKVIKKIFAGEYFELKDLDESTCVKIMTGACVPKILDCIIPIEQAQILNDNSIQFLSVEKPKPFQNIAKQGEDAHKSQLLINKNEVCTPQLLSVLATVGKSKILVYSKPKISLFTTGNEVVPISQIPSTTEIRNSNLYVLLAFLKRLEIQPIFVEHLQDEETKVYNTIKKALENSDCILCTGGVSVGDADLLPNIFEKLEIEKKFHKVKIRPGKPLWFGVTKNGRAVFGLPGNPLAVQVTYKIFVEPFLRNFLGMPQSMPLYLPLKGSKIKKHNLTHFFPAKFFNTQEQTMLQEVPCNGSGDIRAALFSDGLAIQEHNKLYIAEQELVPFYVW